MEAKLTSESEMHGKQFDWVCNWISSQTHIQNLDMGRQMVHSDPIQEIATRME